VNGRDISNSWFRTASAPAELNQSSVTVLPDELVGVASELFGRGMRLALVAGHDDGAALRVVYLFTSGPPDVRIEIEVPLERSNPQLPTLSGVSFPASRFERELRDLFGIEPIGHPQPRRLVLHQHWPDDWYPMRRDAGPPPEMTVSAEQFPFVPVSGTGVYEIPVGPVHAGLIEPGHFRFWVVGETILRMKARLWFVHKGIERLFEGKNVLSGVDLAERISGDTAVGHTLAYCQAVEDARRVVVPEQARILRAVLLELERVYNHVADIGALCNDVGFGLAQAWALSLREELMQLNREVTGHRLLRGGVVPGGAHVERLPAYEELDRVGARFEELVELTGSNAFVMERFTGTATLNESDVHDLGLVGPAARASGVSFDARTAHPNVDLAKEFVPAVRQGGDVLARYQVRIDEVRASLRILVDLIEGPLPLHAHAPRGSASERLTGSGVGIVEGWRGAIVHRVELVGGLLARVKIVDPSFLNWPGLPVSLTNTIVPDFPLANKSFNLSYAGNDL